MDIGGEERSDQADDAVYSDAIDYDGGVLRLGGPDRYPPIMVPVLRRVRLLRREQPCPLQVQSRAPDPEAEAQSEGL